MATPVQELMNGGMGGLEAYLTQATCGEACWHAREDVCRCSCGGKNHGCLRHEGGERPVRTARIDGCRYELAGVGEVEAAARELNGGTTWGATQPGAKARVKLATPAQLESWPELAAAREKIAAIRSRPHCAAEWLCERPYLLWVRID